MFSATTKGSVRQRAAKKSRSSLLKYPILHSGVTSTDLSNLFGNRLTMLMSILICTLSKTMPLLPMDSLTLLQFIWFPDKRSYIYSFLLDVPQKVLEHVLIRKQVVRVMLQYGSVWLYKNKTASESHLFSSVHL